MKVSAEEKDLSPTYLQTINYKEFYSNPGYINKKKQIVDP